MRGHDMLKQINQVDKSQHQYAARIGRLTHHYTAFKQQLSYGILMFAYLDLLRYQLAVVFINVCFRQIEISLYTQEFNNVGNVLAQCLLRCTVGAYTEKYQAKQHIPYTTG